jgi:hypothetical protein
LISSAPPAASNESFILLSNTLIIYYSFYALSANGMFMASPLNYSDFSLIIGPTIFIFETPSIPPTLNLSARFKNLSLESYNPILKEPFAHCTVRIARMSHRSRSLLILEESESWNLKA